MAAEQKGPASVAQKRHVELRLSGFGGQGVILAASILGRAAAVNEGRNAVMAQSYGPESRGGACLAEVIIDDKEVGYPRVVSPDVVVALSQEAYQKYAMQRPPHCLVIAEEDLVQLDPQENKDTVLRVPATRIAEQLGRRIVLNIVTLGFLGGATGVVSSEALRKAIEASVPKGTEAANLRAFEAGYNHAQKLLAERKGSA